MKKILSKITLIDRVIIAIGLLSTIIFGFIFFRSSTHVTAIIKVSEDTIIHNPWVMGVGTRTWFAELFHPGMKESDGLGQVAAEVLDVHSYHTSPDKKAVYLTVKLRAVYNRASNQHTYNGLNLLVGSPIKLNLNHMLVEGLVTHIDGVEDPRNKTKLIVTAQIKRDNPVYTGTSGVEPHIANALNVGDAVRDSRNHAIVTIIDKKVVPAKVITTTNTGEVVVKDDPVKKDVLLTLETNALESSGRYYLFDDISLTIGIGIPLHFNHISVYPEILELHLANHNAE
jgi:hypothetical protein